MRCHPAQLALFLALLLPLGAVEAPGATAPKRPRPRTAPVMIQVRTGLSTGLMRLASPPDGDEPAARAPQPLAPPMPSERPPPPATAVVVTDKIPVANKAAEEAPASTEEAPAATAEASATATDESAASATATAEAAAMATEEEAATSATVTELSPGVVQVPEAGTEAASAPEVAPFDGPAPEVAPFDGPAPGPRGGSAEELPSAAASGMWLMLQLIAVAGVVMLVARHVASHWRKPPAATGLSAEVRQLRITPGAEILSMFGLAGDQGAESGESPPKAPMSPGLLMRVQGRVVGRPEGRLTAPLSGSECVFYAASASQPRHDGVHPPPLAFHAAGSDFTLELSGAPQVSLAVRGHDVALFDMDAGLREWEHAFASAPEQRRSFVLDHLVPAADAAAHFGRCTDLGPSGATLQFRESALQAGRTVTCVGEVARDASGGLVLQPWLPQVKVQLSATAKSTMPWMQILAPWLLWKEAPGSALGSLPRELRADALAGRVLVSDNPDLRGGLLVEGLLG